MIVSGWGTVGSNEGRVGRIWTAIFAFFVRVIDKHWTILGMRFLILTHSYKPITNPRAIRWSAIAEHWARSGHDVDVVCGWKPGLARDEFVEGVGVKRVGGNLSERLRSCMRPREIQPTASSMDVHPNRSVRQMASSGNLLRRLARTCHDLTWKKLYWPDATCLWSIPALKTARALLADHDYDTVVSVSVPFTSHWVGYRLRNLMNQATWVADVGDPFSFLPEAPPNNASIYQQRNIAWEHRVFGAASSVSVTTEPTAARYRQLFPDCADKIVVIPPLATHSAPAVKSSPGSESAAKPIKLVFAGTLYRTIRNPRFLFDLFEQLLRSPLGDRLELHLYGLAHDCGELVEQQRAKLGTRLCVHGPVSASEAQHALREADILVNLGNSTPCQLPSKVVEYAATGKPILNLISIDNDSSTEFLTGYPAALTLRDNAGEHLAEQIEQVVRFVVSPPAVDRMQLEKWLGPYRLTRITAMYETLFSPATIPLTPQNNILEAAPLRHDVELTDKENRA